MHSATGIIKTVIVLMMGMLLAYPLFSQNELTFQVDMNLKINEGVFQPANGDFVVVRGSFNDWSSDSEILDDLDADGIYAGTYDVGGNAGEIMEYKFVIRQPGGGVIWEDQIANRSFQLTGHPATLPVVYFDQNLIFDPQFTRITDGDIPNDGGSSMAAAWGDYDNDGDPDLYVTNAGGENNFLYRNEGGGNFVRITSGDLVNDGADSRSASWGDYDNDGDLDLFVSNGGNNFLYRNDGGGNFILQNSGPIFDDADNSFGASWGDYDNDGDLDLFVANGSGQHNCLYRNDDWEHTFTKISEGDIVNDGGNSWGANWGDYDNDGFLDLFVGNAPNNLLYHNNGDGTFNRITDGPVVSGSNGNGAAWGDYDNDGDLDLFVCSWYDNNNLLYRNDGGGNFSQIIDGDLVTDGGTSSTAVWGDYDNDGALDLYVFDNGGNNFLYHNNQDGSFERIWNMELAFDGGPSRGGAWADYDLDGDLDLFVANAGENNFLYQNNGNGNHWINLKLAGTYSNAAAIGSRVRVRATIGGATVWQTAEIAGQCGRFAQNSLDVEFGLGDAATVEEIQVAWNSGIVQTLTNLPSDQFLTISESGTPDNTQLTFRVNMSEQIAQGNFDPGSQIVVVRGDFEDIAEPTTFLWQGNYFRLYEMGIPDLYELTITMPLSTVGLPFEYKYVIDDLANAGDLTTQGGLWEIGDNRRLTQQFVTQALMPVDFRSELPGPFTRIFDGEIVNDGGTSLGCSWADIDNDGDLDLFVTNGGDNNFLYRNHGGGNFERIWDGEIVNDGGNSRGCSWGDYDNDGDLDLFVANVGENNFLYRNHGDGTFERIWDGEIASDHGYSRSCSWVDYDNDGWLDLFVANSNGEDNFLYKNNGDGSFFRIWDVPFVNDGGESYTGSWGDYDNDGDLDLFVANLNGENNALYQNNGDNSFNRIYDGEMVNDGGNSISCGWGDYDNDRDLDLFVANNSGENNFLYQNNGDGSFTRISEGAIVNDGGNALGSAWADYDNDGWLDLVVTNGDEPSFLYHNNGDGSFERITDGAVATDVNTSRGVAWGDYDNDGDLDLFIAVIGNNLLYQNEGSGNHWISLLCVGNWSNRSAIGTTVGARAQIGGHPVWQTRQISGQTGYYSQSSMNVNFGLGDASQIDELELRWPSGVVQTLNDLPADQFHTIFEEYAGGAMVTHTGDSGPGSLREAIHIANSDGGPTLIDFAPYLRYQVIYPQSELPALMEDYTTIEGDINGDGAPEVGITSPDTSVYNGLIIESAHNLIHGLVLTNFRGSARADNAILIIGDNAFDNRIYGCYIGCEFNGEIPRGNETGIRIVAGAHDNIIGGSLYGEFNRIAYNSYGVVVNNTEPGTDRNRITHNQITGNSRGIVLANGGNNNIAAPLLTYFDGMILRGSAEPLSTVEIFADPRDQGLSFLAEVQSDGSGNFEYAGPFPEWQFYNATVTDAAGNTSQFSVDMYRQGEVNANHWRVTLVNNGNFAYDLLNGQAGGIYPKSSGGAVIYAGGHYLGTLKNGTPSVSQIQHSSEYVPGRITNPIPAPTDQLTSEHPQLTKHQVYVIDSTRSGADWDNWPVEDGAPVDANGNPLLVSQQDSWTVYNDLFPSFHDGTSDPVLGVEIQRSTYSYTYPGAPSEVFFVKWKIINRSNNDYLGTYFGAWFDPDLGNYLNDLAGTDTSLSMVYCYNADDGEEGKAFGAWMAQGAYADGRRLGLTASTIYYNPGEPQNDEERYNYLRGLERWGAPKPYGPFDYSGDPLSGSGSLDWNLADKRIVLSSGPFTLYAGNVQEIVVACIGATGSDRLDAVANLRETVRGVQEFYRRPVLSIGNSKGIAKYKTPMRIALSNVNNLLGADLKLHYDPAILELAPGDVKLTPLLSGFTSTVLVDQSAGIVSVALARATPLALEMPGAVVKLPFMVKKNTPAGSVGNISVTRALLSFQNDSLQTLTPMTVNGSIEVTDSYLFGDLNLNGAFDLTDAILILKVIVERYEEFTPFQGLLSDANMNGKTDLSDALLVLNNLLLNKQNGLSKSLAVSSSAATDTLLPVQMNLPAMEGAAGQEISVPLRAVESGELYGLDAAVSYDPAMLQLVSVRTSGSGDLLASNQQFPGRVHWATVNSVPIGSDEGVLGELVFRVLQTGTHLLTVESCNGAFSRQTIPGDPVPEVFGLAQNYPNPFNAGTTIRYQLPRPAKVNIVLYNIRGQKVATLVNEEKAPGYYTYRWDARSLSSGIYFYRMTAGDYSAVRKLVLIK